MTTIAVPTRLRAARASDLDAIAALEQASFGDPWSRNSFASLLGNDLVHFRVVDRPGTAGALGEPLGYLVAWFVADEGEIANVAVAPAARGQGLGARLLDDALAEAERRGSARLFLEVRESNAVARRLYASRQFVELGRRRRYYQHPVEDALVLRRTLRADDA